VARSLEIGHPPARTVSLSCASQNPAPTGNAKAMPWVRCAHLCHSSPVRGAGEWHSWSERSGV